MDLGAESRCGTGESVVRQQTWKGRGWSATVEGSELEIEEGRHTTSVTSERAAGLEAIRKMLRWELRLDGQRLVRLRGARGREAKAIALAPQLGAIALWADAVTATIDGALARQRWIPRESLAGLERNRPRSELASRVRRLGLEPLLDERERRALAVLVLDLPKVVAETNEKIVQAELRDQRQFFEQIERQPLTEEQARAVICFDNRVQVIAAAGSGKTSVMVARAGYAVARKFIPPERILLLAFNKAAAAELQERISKRLATAGIDPSGVRASTFHSFGLGLIGKATGAKPRLAPWLENGQDVAMVMRIVDELRDASTEFHYKWDLFRLLFASTGTKLGGGTPDSYDRDTRQTGFGTFDGKTVKSQGERLIANWLYLNGVRYEYEHRYPVHVADATHSQYRPDFYYPDIDVWHEHWALDRDGKPPAEFEDYAESMAWKRELHRTQGTTLIETTWADVMFGSGLAGLERELTSRGLTLDWNPDRKIIDGQPVKHDDLVRLVRTFMTHVKSSALDRGGVGDRLETSRRHLRGYRMQLFLDLYWPIHDEWNRRLRDENLVDFEDMLTMSANALEAGAVEAPYDLIMVDEFQDASQARARMVQALVNQPGKYLLTVGDDWQSINRFAGADISVMTDFEEWFGPGPTLQLTKTFRCPQVICDVARAFVTKNPRQIKKKVTSVHGEPGLPVNLIRASGPSHALARYLEELAEGLETGEIKPGSNGRITVNVLGRYRFDQDVMPRRIPSNIDLEFRTVHGAKGLEADFIVVPKLISGTYGFPSDIADDPVLDLVMAAPDDHPHAEERRLFYVALTRARRAVTLITQPGRESPFVTELIRDGHVRVLDEKGNEVRLCQGCAEGTMVPRSGRFGPFLGCSRFPACRATEPLEGEARMGRRGPQAD